MNNINLSDSIELLNCQVNTNKIASLDQKERQILLIACNNLFKEREEDQTKVDTAILNSIKEKLKGTKQASLWKKITNLFLNKIAKIWNKNYWISSSQIQNQFEVQNQFIINVQKQYSNSAEAKLRKNLAVLKNEKYRLESLLDTIKKDSLFIPHNEMLFEMNLFSDNELIQIDHNPSTITDLIELKIIQKQKLINENILAINLFKLN